MEEKDKKHPAQAAAATCLKCRHYYITWDENFPYGCRALAFKSLSPPAATVRSASGLQCQFFTPKKRPGKSGESKRP